MKNAVILFGTSFLVTQNILAAATCVNGQSKVVLNENKTMVVSGLTPSTGISNGKYGCEVIGMGPGYLSVQRQVQCQKLSDPNAVIMGWMIEGLDVFGRKAASVALYNHGGEKVFEAGCKRQ